MNEHIAAAIPHVIHAVISLHIPAENLRLDYLQISLQSWDARTTNPDLIQERYVKEYSE